MLTGGPDKDRVHSTIPLPEIIEEACHSVVAHRLTHAVVVQKVIIRVALHVDVRRGRPFEAWKVRTDGAGRVTELCSASITPATHLLQPHSDAVVAAVRWRRQLCCRATKIRVR